MTLSLTFPSGRHLNQLYCSREDNLSHIETRFGVHILARENTLSIEGPDDAANTVKALFQALSQARTQGITLTQADFEYLLQKVSEGRIGELQELFDKPLILNFKQTSVVPKTVNQKRYLQFLLKQDVVFGIGPAGTGKTYLAVAAALHALNEQRVSRIILTRPAVEAGETLGFLPGDLREKILPYLRPLYDAMNMMIGRAETESLMAKGIIEIAPLAYMRGRTLSSAAIILDEAQNTTTEQMMLFLTRLGEGSRMVITGDITQVDLPKQKPSGLKQAIHILHDIPGIKLFFFDKEDVVRHPLVSQIIKAYEAFHNEG